MTLTIQQKALIVIEYISTHADEDDKEMWKVYEIAHVANGPCSNKHEDWAKSLEEMFQHMIEIGEYKDVK